MKVRFYPECSAFVIEALETRLKNLEGEFDDRDSISFETDTPKFIRAITGREDANMDERVEAARNKSLGRLARNVAKREQIREYIEQLKVGVPEAETLSAIADELLAALLQKAFTFGQMPLPSTMDRDKRSQDLPVLKGQHKELYIYSTALAFGFRIILGLS